MTEDSREEITEILAKMEQGDRSATDRLIPVVYKRLHSLAQRHFKRQSPEHTLQPTALVHEVFIKMVKTPNSDWSGQAHFFCVAAKAMRQVLIDHARRKKAAKRGQDPQRVTLSGLGASKANDLQIDLIALDEALNKLAELSPRQCRIVEMRFLAGMEMDEVGKVLNLTERTLYREWRTAKTFLQIELLGSGLK